MLPALWRRRFWVRLSDVLVIRKEADCKASAHAGLTGVWSVQLRRGPPQLGQTCCCACRFKALGNAIWNTNTCGVHKQVTYYGRRDWRARES